MLALGPPPWEEDVSQLGEGFFEQDYLLKAKCKRIAILRESTQGRRRGLRIQKSVDLKKDTAAKRSFVQPMKPRWIWDELRAVQENHRDVCYLLAVTGET